VSAQCCNRTAHSSELRISRSCKHHYILLCVLNNVDEGGALHFVGDVGTIFNSTFIGNAASDGGALWCDGKNSIASSCFAGNSALQGTIGDCHAVCSNTYALLLQLLLLLLLHHETDVIQLLAV
jgi:hypothetical protein